jgi:hypothetical protein
VSELLRGLSAGREDNARGIEDFAKQLTDSLLPQAGADADIRLLAGCGKS